MTSREKRVLQALAAGLQWDGGHAAVAATLGLQPCHCLNGRANPDSEMPPKRNHTHPEGIPARACAAYPPRHDDRTP